MPDCQICKHTFKKLKFATDHIKICTRCVNSLNENPEPASHAQSRFADMLKRGMERNAQHDLQSNEEWKRLKAHRILNNLDATVAEKLNDWITSLLKKPENSTRDFKIMRAYRRGLLRMDGLADYPTNWRDVARGIRVRDGLRCSSCGTSEHILDVHHIVYLSKHGTNQQNNLVTLCRTCHESEHGRILDSLEKHDPELPTKQLHTHLNEVATAHGSSSDVINEPKPISVLPLVDLNCPKCNSALSAKLTTALLAAQKVRCPICSLVFCADDGFGSRLSRRPVNPAPAPQSSNAKKAPEPSFYQTPQNQGPSTSKNTKNIEVTTSIVSENLTQSSPSTAQDNKTFKKESPAIEKVSAFPWGTSFQILAFLLGWNAATESPHPFGAFLTHWTFWALIFWFIGYMINNKGQASSSGEGPGSGSSSGGS